MLLCEVPTGTAPRMLSIASAQCKSPQLHLRVHTPQPTAHKHNFTVCPGGPVKFNYSNVHQLVEWVEINSMFGAQKFVLYNHSGSDVLQPYIQNYVDEGKVDFLPWPLEVDSKSIKNLGHMALINDCLYRYMYKTKYLVYLDLDELLVPKTEPSWVKTISSLHCENKVEAIFKNVFFKTEWSDDEVFSGNQTVQRLHLLSLLKSKRESKIWPHRSRSKYIIRPQKINVAGVHFAHGQVSKPSSTCLVPDSVAWVQHYRNWDDPKPGWVVDRQLHTLSDAIILRAGAVHQRVDRATGLR